VYPNAPLGPALDEQGEMIAFFANLFGPYPFDAYGIVVVEGLGAALETQSFTVFGEPITRGPAFERILVHELVHQWFGDLVSPATWRDTWLNEGFASYGEWLWTEHRNGREALDEAIAQERERLAAGDFPPPATPPDDQLFGIAVYRVGALALHALRLEIGDDAFFSTLRTYLERFAFSTASTADFIAVTEEVAQRRLDDFFDAWLFDPAIPEFPTG
jgi:aminopeptidase N